MGGRWVFAVKDGPGESEIFKARYVAKGYTQVHGIDYFDTFSPTAKLTSVRTLMQINADIDCEIYVTQPEGYVQSDGKELLVWKLFKSLYGLKQSGRNWNNLLHKFFISNKFVEPSVDPCVYFYICQSELVIVLIWVDDILLAANSDASICKIKDMLKITFKMKDLGPISCFLGINFAQVAGGAEISTKSFRKVWYGSM